MTAHLRRWGFAALLLAGAAQALAAGRSFEDAEGHRLTLPERPQRVVALSEIDLDTALALGVTPVGATDGRGQAAPPRYLENHLPDGVQAVGALNNPNLERLLELAPDLILTGPVKPEQLAILNDIAPTVVSYRVDEPWQQSMLRTARALGREAEGQAVLARYQARVDTARARLAGHRGESLSIVRWNPKGPSYMFHDAFASRVIRDIGLVRPASQRDAGTTHSMALSLESLEWLDGDWLVIGTLAASGEAVDALGQARQTPAFGQLSAIARGHFAAVDGSVWTSSGGPLAALQVIEDTEALLTGTDTGVAARP